MTLPVPRLGEVVSFKVYYPTLKQSAEHKNVRVVRSFPWLTMYQFCVEVEKDDPIRQTGFHVRVIDMQHIVELNGKKVSNTDTSEQKVQVPASKGKGFYTVLLRGGVGVDCECTGFKFRKSCRHLKEAEGLVDK